MGTAFEPMDPSTTITVPSQNVTIVATYDPIYFTIQTSSSPTTGGSTSGGGSAAYGTSCTVTASAVGGFIFDGWTEDGILASSSASYTFQVTSDRNLVANYGSVYMVVDLSGGPTAASYPVTYLSAIPENGWTDTHKTTELVLRRYPAGSFTMGSPTDELGRMPNETQHQVALTKNFYIGVFEVTQRQWQLVMGNKPSFFNNATYYQTRPVEQVSYFEIRENPNNSAISLNWPASSQVHDGSFMGNLRAKTGLSGFDLPTEAQWEYACRAWTTTALNSGKNLMYTGPCENMSEVGRYYYNGGLSSTQDSDPSSGTALTGRFRANLIGLYDMHGNVSEWCLDWYGSYPGDIQNPVGPASGTKRIHRGGNWSGGPGGCRSANRGIDNPNARDSHIGFRPAMTLP